MIYYRLYRLLMKVAHHFNWHYAPPIYPDGDTMLWCHWCGFRQVIRRRGDKFSTLDSYSGLTKLRETGLDFSPRGENDKEGK